MKRLIKFFRPLIILMFRTWWYITSPKTSGAKVLIICGDEILLIKTTYGYSYSLPGGGIKKGETPEEAVRREAEEEVRIVLGKVHRLPSFVTYEENKEDTVYGFCAYVTSKDYKLDALEIDKAEWHPLNNIPKTVGPVTFKIITLFKEHSLQ